MLKFGIISSVSPAKGTAKVKFQDLEIESGNLPVMQLGTRKNKGSVWPDVGEMVVCLMDKQLETGVILGAVYNDEDKPQSASQNTLSVKFENGDTLSYNRSSGVLNFSVSDVDFELASDGIQIKKGAKNLKTILTDLLTDLSTEPNLTKQANYLQYITDVGALLK